MTRDLPFVAESKVSNQVKKLRMGLIGPGFIAAHHLDAVRRLVDVEIVGLAGSNRMSAETRAAEMGVPHVFDDYLDLIHNADVQVVHNTTPSYLHHEINLAAVLAGKHVISDKPLAWTAQQCAELRDAATATGVLGAVTFNYRGNAMVQQAREIVASGELGQHIYVQGHYLQDWLADENVFSWRVDPQVSGSAATLPDVGAHWCDLAEYISGSKIVSVLACVDTFVHTRYRAPGHGGTFGSRPDGDLSPVMVEGDDVSSICLKFENGARGSLRVSQILPGHKNDLSIEINGRLASIRWEQENSNALWVGYHDRPNVILNNDPKMLGKAARPYSPYPAGHQPGWADAFHAVIADAYAWIADGDTKPRPATVCTFADAYRTACVVDAMLSSRAQGGVWLDVGDPCPEIGHGESSVTAEGCSV